MKTKAKHPFLRALCILIIVGIVGAVIAAAKFLVFSDYEPSASASVMLLYEDASKGLAPDGTKMIGDTLVTTATIEKALASLGLTGKYDVSRIRNSLSITGSYPKDVIDRLTSIRSVVGTDALSGTANEMRISNYFPTVFTIKLKTDFDKNIPEKDLTALLDAIVTASKEQFLGKYSFTYDYGFKSSVLDQSDFDYTQKLNVIRARLDALKRYADKLYNLRTSFAVEGVSFHDIVMKCTAMEQYDLRDIESSIRLQALSTDASRLICQYEYAVVTAGFRLGAVEQNLENVTETISTYPKAEDMYFLSGNVAEKIPGNSEETYNKLIETQRGYNARIASLSAEITDYKTLLSMLRSSPAPKATYDALDAKIAGINQRIADAEAEFTRLVDAYNKKYLSAENGFGTEAAKFDSHSILSGAFAVEVVKDAGALCAVALAIILFCSFRRELAAAKAKKVKAA